jgi:hypothetical protein
VNVVEVVEMDDVALPLLVWRNGLVDDPRLGERLGPASFAPAAGPQCSGSGRRCSQRQVSAMADVSQQRTREGWFCLALVLECFSRSASAGDGRPHPLGVRRRRAADSPLEPPASQGVPTHSCWPSSNACRFQIGVSCLRSSMSRRAASNGLSTVWRTGRYHDRDVADREQAGAVHGGDGAHRHVGNDSLAHPLQHGECVRVRDVLERRHSLAAVRVPNQSGEGDGAARVRVVDRGQHLLSCEGHGADLDQAQDAHASVYSCG